VLRSLPFDPMHHEHETRMGGGMNHMEHMETGHHHHMDHHDRMDHHVSPTQLSQRHP
jgi:hypothetical protein